MNADRTKKKLTSSSYLRIQLYRNHGFCPKKRDKKKGTIAGQIFKTCVYSSTIRHESINILVCQGIPPAMATNDGQISKMQLRKLIRLF